MKSQLSTKSLKKLKNALPNNGIEEIACRLNISQATISRVFNNKNIKSQLEVVNCAIQLIEEAKKEVQELENKIQSL